MVKLKAFDKFDNTSEALEAVAKLVEGTSSQQGSPQIYQS